MNNFITIIKSLLYKFTNICRWGIRLLYPLGIMDLFLQKFLSCSDTDADNHLSGEGSKKPIRRKKKRNTLSRDYINELIIIDELDGFDDEVNKNLADKLITMENENEFKSITLDYNVRKIVLYLFERWNQKYDLLQWLRDKAEPCSWLWDGK
jgi:hypothetical protein